LTDMVQTLAQEIGVATNSEVRAWCRAVEVCAESHLREAKVAFPWLRLGPQGAKEMVEARAAKAAEWLAIERFFPNESALSDAADRFEGAIRELTALRSRLANDSGAASGQAKRVDALIQAMQQSISEAVSLERRLRNVAQRSEDMFAAMQFDFL